MKRNLVIGMSALLVVGLGVYFFLGLNTQQQSENQATSEQRKIPRVPAALNPPGGATTAELRNGHLKFSATGGRFAPKPVSLNFDATNSREISLSRSFDLSLKYRAAPFNRYRTENGPKKATINGFIIYESLNAPLAFEDAIRFEPGSFPVVRDRNNGLIGLLSGRVIAKLHDHDFDVASLVGGEKIYEAAHLGVCYIRLPEGANLLEAYDALQGHDEIIRADIEILQGGVSIK